MDTTSRTPLMFRQKSYNHFEMFIYKHPQDAKKQTPFKMESAKH